MPDAASLAALAIQVLKQTTEGLTALRERAQRSKDIEIKEQIGTLFDNVLQLKDIVSRLVDQNKILQNKLQDQQHDSLKPEPQQVGQTIYYFVGSKGPYCRPCYDKDKRLALLTPQKRDEFHAAGGVYRWCDVCQHSFYESRGASQRQITPFMTD